MLAPTETVLQVERNVLGACMADEASIWKTVALLNRDSFANEEHGLIFSAILALHEKRLSADPLSVCDWLETHGGLQKAGGSEYVRSLSTQADLPNVETHCNLILDMVGNRRLMSLALEMAGTFRDGSFDDNYARIQSELLKISPKNQKAFRASEDLVLDAMIEIRLRIDEPVECAGLRTGYADFDRKFSGLLPGLHVVQGRTSSGKTWFALGLAEGVAQHGIKSAFISLEMTDKFVTLRRLSRHSHIKQDSLLTGRMWEQDPFGDWHTRDFNQAEKDRVEKASFKVSDIPVFVNSGYDMTSSKVRALLARMKAEQGIGFAAVDYIQKFNDKAETQEMSWGRAAHNLKETADSLNIPIVLVSQVNRDVKGRGERFLDIGDARGSGQIDEAADTIFSITSQDYEKKNDPNYKRTYIVELQCLKDRQLGHAGRMIDLYSDPITGAIDPVPNDKRRVGVE